MPTRSLEAFRAPPLALLATEPFRAALEFFTAKLGQPPRVRGDGHAVVIYPGLGAGALHTSQLRGYLRACNFDVHDWGLGVNRGPQGEMDAWLDTLSGRVRELHASTGRKVSLLGWSLGGIYAREVAKACPDAVRQVITLATPFRSVGGGNHAGTLFKMIGGTRRVSAHARVAGPPAAAATGSGHLDLQPQGRHGQLERLPRDPGGRRRERGGGRQPPGMPTHAEVLRVVADRLAQPEGQWRPYLSATTAPSRSTR
ncbi:hypothetical protein HK414_19560 [Ramlibacter terrae]|uniref:Alpha/beta fold hydrolase n=1 Tax=Ramlibacter terrae TaxID=2732511 RepID=A0ABX6P7N0_9BURK|nr:hypothetical protein HK414_19560 [Ramlibacter terrae]